MSTLNWVSPISTSWRSFYWQLLTKYKIIYGCLQVQQPRQNQMHSVVYLRKRWHMGDGMKTLTKSTSPPPFKQPIKESGWSSLICLAFVLENSSQWSKTFLDSLHSAMLHSQQMSLAEVPRRVNQSLQSEDFRSCLEKSCPPFRVTSCVESCQAWSCMEMQFLTGNWGGLGSLWGLGPNSFNSDCLFKTNFPKYKNI